ncbi:MAG: CbiX/SirB N-terminal domain-containing protein [Planctomycetota bacterium]
MFGSGPNDEIGVVIIAHGSRRAEANQDLFQLVERFRGRGFSRVYPAFLELAPPDIVASGRQAAADGAKSLVLLPYFLSAGNHVVEDLEDARTELSLQFPQITVVLAKPLGPHPLLEEILAARLRESMVDE